MTMNTRKIQKMTMNIRTFQKMTRNYKEDSDLKDDGGRKRRF